MGCGASKPPPVQTASAPKPPAPASPPPVPKVCVPRTLDSVDTEEQLFLANVYHRKQRRNSIYEARIRGQQSHEHVCIIFTSKLYPLGVGSTSSLYAGNKENESKSCLVRLVLLVLYIFAPGLHHMD
eukprot:9350226-Pyramimonas_sp.AAC.2